MLDGLKDRVGRELCARIFDDFMGGTKAALQETSILGKGEGILP